MKVYFILMGLYPIETEYNLSKERYQLESMYQACFMQKKIWGKTIGIMITNTVRTPDRMILDENINQN